MLLNHKILKKDLGFKISANLKDYDKTYKTFTWHEAEKEVAHLANHKLNAAHIAIDVHTNTFRKNKIALYYTNAKGSKEEYTFTQLSELSNQFANALTSHAEKKGNRVFIFFSRIPEVYISF